MSVKFYIDGYTPDPKKFSGMVGQREADLDEAMLEYYGLKEALERVAANLLKQYGSHTTSDKSHVVGIEIFGLSFNFILDKDHKQ
jgi:hypothetical protein